TTVHTHGIHAIAGGRTLLQAKLTTLVHAHLEQVIVGRSNRDRVTAVHAYGIHAVAGCGRRAEATLLVRAHSQELGIGCSFRNSVAAGHAYGIHSVACGAYCAGRHVLVSARLRVVRGCACLHDASEGADDEQECLTIDIHDVRAFLLD